MDDFRVASDTDNEGGENHNPYWDVKGYVYFIHCPTNDYVKIGFTQNDPNVRFRVHNNASPVPLRKFRLMHGTMGLERDLHGRFAEYLAEGKREWFVPNESLLDYMEANATNWARLLDADRPVAKVVRTNDLMHAVIDRQRMLPITVGDLAQKEAADEIIAVPIGRKAVLESKRGGRPKKPRSVVPPKRYGPLQEMLDKLDRHMNRSFD